MVPELFHHDTCSKYKKYPQYSWKFIISVTSNEDTGSCLRDWYGEECWIHFLLTRPRSSDLVLCIIMCDSKQTKLSKKEQSGYRISETKAQTISTNSVKETFCWVKTHVWRKAHSKKVQQLHEESQCSDSHIIFWSPLHFGWNITKKEYKHKAGIYVQEI